MIRFNCTSCGKAFKVEDKHAGRNARCACGATVAVPTATEEELVMPGAAPPGQGPPSSQAPVATAGNAPLFTLTNVQKVNLGTGRGFYDFQFFDDLLIVRHADGEVVAQIPRAEAPDRIARKLNYAYRFTDNDGRKQMFGLNYGGGRKFKSKEAFDRWIAGESVDDIMAEAEPTDLRPGQMSPKLAINLAYGYAAFIILASTFLLIMSASQNPEGVPWIAIPLGGMVVVLIGMVLKQPWAAILGMVLCILAVIDAGGTLAYYGLGFDKTVRLKGAGYFILIIRMIIFGGAAQTFWFAFGAIRTKRNEAATA